MNKEATAAEGTAMVWNKSPSRLFALIIGINDYLNSNPKFKSLKGAVPDADEMYSFLTADLKVPTDQIIILRDEAASRQAIINSFVKLRDDTRIEHGDPILIFYAGHGGSDKATDAWARKYGPIQVEVIYPSDFGAEIPGSTETVNCIPDTTIAGLINQLSTAKGDNITVIFDSCFSASGTRKGMSGQIRCTEAKVNIPLNIDEDILQRSDIPSFKQKDIDARRTKLMLYIDQTSHVHLAACSSNGKAWEDKGRGNFTSALLETLRAWGADKITYQNFMISLPDMPNKQSPHCYGSNKSRVFFNLRAPSRKTSCIPVKVESGRITLQAGAASGVTFKSIWELYKLPTEDSPALGRSFSKTPHLFTTVLEPEHEITDKETRLYARHVHYGTGNELKVWFSPEAKELIIPDRENGSSDVRDMPVGSGEHEVGYVVHPAEDGADIVVRLYDSGNPNTEPEVTFHLCDSQAVAHGVATLRHRKPARRSEVEPILFAAAKWKWHLRRTNVAHTKELVKAEMMKVAERDDPKGGKYSALEEYSQMLDSDAAGVVDFVVRWKDLYGIKLTSQTRDQLYVRLFYFDTADFSICEAQFPFLSISNTMLTGLLAVDLFGHSAAAGEADPELPESGDLLIGDGGNGGQPFPFTIGEGERLELGYLKVFWSTKPLELNNLRQESVFDEKQDVRGMSMGPRGATQDWGTITLTLVQRAPEDGPGAS